MRRDTNFHKTYKSQCVDVIPPGKSIDAKVLQLMLFPTDTFRIREKKWNWKNTRKNTGMDWLVLIHIRYHWEHSVSSMWLTRGLTSETMQRNQTYMVLASRLTKNHMRIYKYVMCMCALDTFHKHWSRTTLFIGCGFGVQSCRTTGRGKAGGTARWTWQGGPVMAYTG